jgi:hypothetical protein
VSEFFSDVLTAIGLFLTLFGAAIAARAVILSKGSAVKIGAGALAGNTDEENLPLPMVQNLLKTSQHAKIGLLLIAGGTLLQLLPVLSRIFF